MKALTRSRVMQVWFAAVALLVVAAMAVGVGMTIGTGAVLLALSLVPAVVIWVLWPGVQSPTARDVLGGIDHRS